MIKGDVIAFINPNKKGRFGHVAVVEEELYRSENKVVVRVIDSSQIKHIDDIRQSEILIDFMKNNFEGLLDYLSERKSENQPCGWVPDTTLFLFDNDVFIGFYNVRHYLNETLEKIGGHIAYQIIPSQRKKGYVKAGLKLILNWCRKNLGLEEVLLSCKSENIGSDKAMTSVMNEMGGRRRPDISIDGHIERSVWIKTMK